MEGQRAGAEQAAFSHGDKDATCRRRAPDTRRTTDEARGPRLGAPGRTGVDKEERQEGIGPGQLQRGVDRQPRARAPTSCSGALRPAQVHLPSLIRPRLCKQQPPWPAGERCHCSVNVVASVRFSEALCSCTTRLTLLKVLLLRSGCCCSGAVMVVQNTMQQSSLPRHFDPPSALKQQHDAAHAVLPSCSCTHAAAVLCCCRCTTRRVGAARGRAGRPDPPPKASQSSSKLQLTQPSRV
jgi:hypothetical protein